MYIADEFVARADRVQRDLILPDGRRIWVIALPLPSLLKWRLRDAWEVFRGRAEAVREATAHDYLALERRADALKAERKGD